MCQDCGCGLLLPTPDAGSPAHAPTGPSPPHAHDHPHPHHPPHEPAGHAAPADEAAAPEVSRHLPILRSLLERNERFAERNRGFFRAKRLLVLNVLSAPGSGKTELIEKTAVALRPALRVGVIVGDLATDLDARRLRAAGIPVVQIATGTLCHLEAEMVGRAADSMDLDALDILAIENVGNLVCPASYDLGESLRVVLLSVTEGEDKPLKYPPLFHSAQAALITKLDLAGAVGFDRQHARSNLERVSHHARLFEVSARTGTGMDAWTAYLAEQHRAHCG